MEEHARLAGEAAVGGDVEEGRGGRGGCDPQVRGGAGCVVDAEFLGEAKGGVDGGFIG